MSGKSHSGDMEMTWHGRQRFIRSRLCSGFGNGVFGKLPSHQMAVAIMCLIGKEIREIHFGHRALPYILCAYKYIQCL